MKQDIINRAGIYSWINHDLEMNRYFQRLSGVMERVILKPLGHEHINRIAVAYP